MVGVHAGRPVYLRDIAEKVQDGLAEPDTCVLFANARGGPEQKRGADYPAVTITLSKRKGTNATDVSRRLLDKINVLRGYVLPNDLNVTVTRNYGETAKDKSDELLKHLLIATLSVTLLIALALGWRESGVVLLAVPVTLALTLGVFYLYGYTLNRVTLFALIFSIGILVDDAIVVVENIARHFRLPESRGRSVMELVVEAVDEVGNPTILATFAVIAAVLPNAFVRGLAGPYMRPIPVGASAAMLFSLVVAFVVLPWAAARLLKRYRGIVSHSGQQGESTPLEETTHVAHALAQYLGKQPEVMNYLVRHYFLRNQPNQADIQVNLLLRHNRRASKPRDCAPLWAGDFAA